MPLLPSVRISCMEKAPFSSALTVVVVKLFTETPTFARGSVVLVSVSDVFALLNKPDPAAGPLRPGIEALTYQHEYVIKLNRIAYLN